MKQIFQTPGLARRMASWVYEGMLLFGVVFLAGYLFGTLTQSRHALQNRHELQAFLFIIFGIYFVWFWAKGQTLAMKTWNIRIVSKSGNSLSQKHALIRYLTSWLWFAPPLLLAVPLQWGPATTSLGMVIWVVLWSLCSLFHPEKQFLHDALAGTRLIHSDPMSRR